MAQEQCGCTNRAAWKKGGCQQQGAGCSLQMLGHLGGWAQHPAKAAVQEHRHMHPVCQGLGDLSNLHPSGQGVSPQFLSQVISF